jgi:hypothetical protein
MRIDFMLFDKILGDSDIINDNWKKEIDKWLVFIENKGELKRFIPRLIKMNNSKRDEALAEISSAYLLENELNFVMFNGVFTNSHFLLLFSFKLIF